MALAEQEKHARIAHGDGDFRSAECIKLLKEADIIATNPPFSLFREYLGQLESYGKKFVIVGNMNAVTYKEVFPLIAQNKLWLGYNSGHFWFKVPDTYEEKKTDFKIDENGQKWRRMGNICFFTNLDIEKRHEDMPLFRNYTPEAYPKYDNYDAIEVSKTADIPCDYYEAIGVPITFADKYNPDQFEIIGASESEGTGFSNGLWNSSSGIAQPIVNGERKYKRLFIRAVNGGGYDLLTIYELVETVKNLFGYSDDEISVCSGIMGVPITFLDKYNPDQFEIIRFRRGNDDKDLSVNGKCPYFRILIRRKR